MIGDDDGHESLASTADATGAAPAALDRGLTYRELADRLGLSLDAARALAKRRGWKSITDETGRAFVSVDPAELAQLSEKRRIKAAPGRPPGEEATRIAQLVAVIKAERDALGNVSGESGGPVDEARLAALMRQFLAAREQERLDWERRMGQLDVELAEAKATIAAAQQQYERAAQQHEQAIADLELLQNHQRSIWLLDRRRLEITIRGLEAAGERRWYRSAWRSLPRPAVAAALLLALLAGIALSQDSAAHGAVIAAPPEAGPQASPGQPCGQIPDCGRLPDSAANQTRFLVDKFLTHMVQELGGSAWSLAAARRTGREESVSASP